MFQSFKLVLTIHIIFYLLFKTVHVDGFTNIFGELFNDLKFGSIEGELTQKILNRKPKCTKGSYAINDSCFFLSDKKLSEDDENEILEKIWDVIEERKESIKFLPGSVFSRIPVRTTWENAKNFCNQIDKYSSLVLFNRKNEEFESMVEFLKSLSKNNKYWIGLTYQNSGYQWINGMVLNNTAVQKIMNQNRNNYKTCAVLNINDNVKIEWEDCKSAEYNFICRYVYDRCVNNSYCGKNGACVNVPSKQTIECRCRIFYEGARCDKWSNHGIQMLLAITIIISALIFILLNGIYSRIKEKIESRKDKDNQHENNLKQYNDHEHEASIPFIGSKVSILTSDLHFKDLCCKIIKKKSKLLILFILSLLISIGLIVGISVTRYKIIKKRIEKFKASTNQELEKSIDKDRISSFTTFFSIDICKVMKSQFLEDYILIALSLSLTIFIYFWNAFSFNRDRESFFRFSFNQESNSKKSVFRDSFSFTLFGIRCNCNKEFPIPMNPFSKRNRFLTCIIYAGYTYNILKIFEFLGNDDSFYENNESVGIIQNFNLTNNVTVIRDQFKNTTQQIVKAAKYGILMGLLKQIMVVFVIGLRYYPVLLCINLKRKSKVSYLLCTWYIFFLLFYYVYMNTFCLLSAYSTIIQAYQKISDEKSVYSAIDKVRRTEIAEIQAIQSLNSSQIAQPLRITSSKPTVTYSKVLPNNRDIKNNITEIINDQLFLRNFMFEKLLFYTILCLMSFYMMTESIILIIQWIKKKKLHEEEHETESKEEDTILSKIRTGDKVDNELKYTRELFRKQKRISFAQHFISKYIYDNRRYFRFSKEYINTNLIAFILLYYITCLIIRKSNTIVSFSSNLIIMLLKFIYELDSESDIGDIASNSRLKKMVTSLHHEIPHYIVVACCITTSIYVIQLLLGIKKYHKHILNGYKGVYEDIPSPKKISNDELVLNSLHYSGYAIGYLLWGYLILFEMSLIAIVLLRFIIQIYVLAENIAKIVLPVLTIYLLKRILMWYLCSYLVSNDKRFVLKNRKFYFVLHHFNFFFDCFLGSFVCFIRMAKSSLAALFFMPRLDYSIFGGFLQSKDMGFISYVSFIHMEINQTHPVKLAFCELMRQSLLEESDKSKRSKILRNKWFVLKTLLKNPHLRRLRKRYLYQQSLISRVETFEQFKIRIKKGILKKSNSIPSLADDLEQKNNIKNEFEIIPPPVPPKPKKK